MNHALATPYLVPPAAPAANTAGWLEVVSHTDPLYGGLSSAVPALGLRLEEYADINISLAAFCLPEQRYTPTGYTHDQISFWPTSRTAWFQGSLRDSFTEQVRGSQGIHIHGLWEQSTAVAAHTANSLRVPYILSAHGMLEPWALHAKRLKKLIYSVLLERKNVANAACLHALTQAEAGQYVHFGARCPIAVIPNGVDIPDEKDATLFLRQFPELAGKRIILFLARLHPKKGIDLLLEAWAELSTSWPDAHLVLAGPDSEGTQAKLEEMIGQYRLGSSVTFTGMLRDRMKWSAFAAAECFVLPSYSEGLSVSVLEAMGMGVPVIVTDACNMPEVREADAGWVISPTRNDLTRALSEMLSNPSNRSRQLGWNGANLIESLYSWPVVARQMSQLYEWVLGGPRPKTFQIIIP